MPDKSDHKKAWQTAQRALQIARDAEGWASRVPTPAPPTFLQKAQWIGGITLALIGVAGVLYRFYPSIEVRSVDGDTSFMPTNARFSYRNVGRLPISDVIISCRIDTADHPNSVFRGNLFDGVGQRLGWFYPNSPAIIRTCSDERFIHFRLLHPSTITVDVSWHSLPIGHQHFVSKPGDSGAFKMVPESDPLPLRRP
jgi:hypothetical protein